MMYFVLAWMASGAAIVIYAEAADRRAWNEQITWGDLISGFCGGVFLGPFALAILVIEWMTSKSFWNRPLVPKSKRKTDGAP